jgi:hypothetical protein
MVIGAEYRGGRAYFICQCDCGRQKSIRVDGVLSGHSKSCGCFNPKGRLIHGHARSPEYKVWVAAKQRCKNQKDARYKDYGGRGISLSPDWESFENFHRDMGSRPSSLHTLDRIDNNKGYEKENCRWTTQPVQQRNRSNNRRITFNGVTLCITDWAARTGISLSTLRKRISNGWELEKALTLPPDERYRR